MLTQPWFYVVIVLCDSLHVITDLHVLHLIFLPLISLHLILLKFKLSLHMCIIVTLKCFKRWHLVICEMIQGNRLHRCSDTHTIVEQLQLMKMDDVGTNSISIEKILRVWDEHQNSFVPTHGNETHAHMLTNILIQISWPIMQIAGETTKFITFSGVISGDISTNLAIQIPNPF